jgi:hypothetical protein
MISSFVLLGKGCLRPAMAEIVTNRPLMILPKAFLLGLIGPYHPTVQGLIELACSHQPLTNPMVQARTRDTQHASQFGRPPFIRQEFLARPAARA